MPRAPLPQNEEARLAALYSYEILDTAFDAVFDEIAALARWLTAAPIGLITLLDAHRQWFKANPGLAAREIPRDHAFCAHAILGHGILVVEDARADARFADNPLVTGAPHARFYAGVPVLNPDGYALGTLCVIDRVPREMNQRQRGVLHTLGAITSSGLELHRTMRLARRLASREPTAEAEARRGMEIMLTPLIMAGLRMQELHHSAGNGEALSGPAGDHEVAAILAQLQQQNQLLVPLIERLNLKLAEVARRCAKDHLAELVKKPAW